MSKKRPPRKPRAKTNRTPSERRRREKRPPRPASRKHDAGTRSGRSGPPRTDAQRTSIGSRSTLDTLTTELVDLKRNVAKNLHAMGVRLARIKGERLWEHGGYTGFDDYLAKGVELGRTTAYELIRIARSFREPVAAQHGYDKLRAVISWMACAPEKELQRSDVFSADIRLRDDSGRFETKPLRRASATEIREATSLLRDARAGSGRVTRDMKDRLRDLEELLPAAPRGTQSGERIRLRRGRDGKLAVTFQAIGLDDFEAFIEVLSKWMA